MVPKALGAQSLEVSVKYPVLRIQKTMYDSAFCMRKHSNNLAVK